MREIKFRAWNNRTKWMHDWLDLCCLPHTLKFFDEPKPYILMQYTGLKDKNGIEIYEGDIVRNIWHNCCDRFIGGIWIVKYGSHSVQGDYYYSNRATGFYYENIKTKETYNIEYLPCNKAGDFECIGNIYENPELLNVSQ